MGAANYTVERAPAADGPWRSVGEGIDESSVQYCPLFSDESAPAGEWFYRVLAKNSAGVSKPSNVVGPVNVTHDTLVDNLADFSKVQARQGALEIQSHKCRDAKEDAYRAAGRAGDALIYQLPTAIEGFRVFAFFPGEVADLKFSVSDVARPTDMSPAGRTDYFSGAGDYNYWKPVLYHAENVSGSGKFLKIEMTGQTQIGRVEITHALDNN